MNHKYLLSICIPTYNRSSYLEGTLKSVVSQSAFAGGEVEIIISDNCSTDDTGDVAQKFIKKYGSAIKYFRNDSNLSDVNMELSLSRGSGEFLKLSNDTLRFLPGSLGKILDVIREFKAQKPVLFFSNGVLSEVGVKRCEGLDEFISTVSFYNTWIASFGIWKSDFDGYKDFSKYAHLKLTQTCVLCEFIAKKKSSVVIHDVFFEVLTPKNKGGYNIAEVFGQNYLDILSMFVRSGALSPNVFEKEKKKILTKHINYFYFDHKKEYAFDKSGYFKFLLPYYKHNVYFYTAYANEIIKSMRRKTVKFLYSKKIDGDRKNYFVFGFKVFSKNLRCTPWEKANKHNFTHIAGSFDQSKVTVGRYTYGGLSVLTHGSGPEKLNIASFCSIAPEVVFILSSDHDHAALSTYPFKVKLGLEDKEASSKGDITVGDDVWIGMRSIILSGVNIGRGAIVAAGSVVTKNVEPYSIVGGNPAKHIKYRFDEETRCKLMSFDFDSLTEESMKRNIDALYTHLNAQNADGILARLK